MLVIISLLLLVSLLSVMLILTSSASRQINYDTLPKQLYSFSLDINSDFKKKPEKVVCKVKVLCRSKLIRY